MGGIIYEFLNHYFPGIYWPKASIIDVIEILLVAYFVYKILVWIKNTKAWMLLRGIVFLGVFMLVAFIFNMHTILWIAKNGIGVLATAAVVIFQPELRRGLEKLGERNILKSVVSFNKTEEKKRFQEETIEGIVRAVFEMSPVKTGALIVVEQAIQLTEYETTGIQMDCLVSTQVLVNIFEHNTPLHDGAVIIRGNRIVSATCYLPLSDNSRLSKALGTRHRAAVGMSEVSDALVIVVSEETGHVSVALGGELTRNVTPEILLQKLNSIQKKTQETKRLSALWKGRGKNERKAD